MVELALLCAGLSRVLAAAPATLPLAVAAEIERLHGQSVAITDTGYVIEDIAGEGRPIVGTVERRGSTLALVTEDGTSYQLAGTLARPRIAGPGYKVWALGEITAGPDGMTLSARRLGVLALPLTR